MRFFHNQIGLWTIVCFVLFGWYATKGQPPASDPYSHRNYYKIREKFFNELGISIADWERKKAEGHALAEEEKDGMIEHFERWSWLMRGRMDPTGRLPDMKVLAREFDRYRKAHPEHFAATVRTPTWEPVGTAQVPLDGGGAGRINVIALDPTNYATIYAGAAGGGIWKSTDGGLSWIPLGDQLPVTSVADIAIDPINPNIIYVATGDGYGYELTWQSDQDFWGGVYTAGILKSVDGGWTWQATGLSYEQDDLDIIQRIVVHPIETNIVLAATRKGIYRSTDGGATFSQVESTHCYDFAFKPSNPDTIYTAGNKDVLISVDKGATWSVLADNVASTGRISIETTAANPMVIYLFSENGTFKKSDDGGVTWVNKAKPNSKTYFFGYYDTDFAVSDVDENYLVAGGIEVVVSDDGATSWKKVSVSNPHTAVNYVHVDGKWALFLPGSASTIYVANDGGVFRTDDFGQTWTDLSNGLQTAQIYRLGSSFTQPDKVITGWQDNGTNLWDGTTNTWRHILGADGMECIIDPTNENILYASTQYGGLNKSVNNGQSWTYIAPAMGDWITPYVLDPANPQVLYYGSSSLYKSVNGGTSWTSLGSFGANISAIAIAPGNSSVLYVATLTSLRRSTDGGSNWVNITSGLPVNMAGINYLAVSPDDPDVVYVAMSAYSPGNKVFVSYDGGANWTNLSGSLPNVPVNTIVYENGSDGGVYIGTDLGVFYRNNTMTDWIPYMDGLPNVMVHELEINETSQKLVAATYGRGVWQSELYGYVQYDHDVGVTQIIQPSATYCAEVVTPLVKVKNFGAQTVTAFDLLYQLNGGTLMSVSWNGLLLPKATTVVSLPSEWAGEGFHTLWVSTHLPNGMADQQTTNDGKTVDFEVVPVGVSLPFTEDYESGQLPVAWSYQNAEGLWEITDTTGGYGASSFSARAVFYSQPEGIKNSMISPFLNLTNTLPPVTLQWDHAYCKRSVKKSDTLTVAVSVDCGVSWQTVWKKGGSDLATAPDLKNQLFIPTSDQWVTEWVLLDSFIGAERLLIRFEAKGGQGNALYLDNIGLWGVTTALGALPQTLTVFPNPVHRLLTYHWADFGVSDQLQLRNVLNQVVRSVGIAPNGSGQLDVSDIPDGAYFLCVERAGKIAALQLLAIQNNP